jgi:hypothetical protein
MQSIACESRGSATAAQIRAASLFAVRRLPAHEAGAVILGPAHEHPFPHERMVAGHGDLDRASLRLADAVEVRERHGELRPASELAPASLLLAVEALGLERSEQDRHLGSCQALIFDRPREGEQEGLA